MFLSPLEEVVPVCMLLDNSQIAAISEILEVNEFQDQRCRAIYQVIVELDSLFQGNETIDVNAVVYQLKERGLFEIAGGYDYLEKLFRETKAGDGSLAMHYAESLLAAYGHPVERTRDLRPDYKEYLASAEWKAKADFMKRGAGNRCQICNAGGVTLDTHHRTYERLGHESPQDLVVLCRGCHTLFHENCKLAR